MGKYHVCYMKRMACVQTSKAPTSTIIFFLIFLHSLYFLTEAKTPPVCTSPRDLRTGLCYVPIIVAKKTYQHATDYCNTYVTGGYLARVHSSQTLNIILDSNVFTNYRNKYWIGIGDSDADGVLTWWNGTVYAAGDYPPEDPPRWRVANSNSLSGKCMVYNHEVENEGSVWDLEDCDQQNHFICEFIGASCATLEAYTTNGIIVAATTDIMDAGSAMVVGKTISFECDEGYARDTGNGQRQFWWECSNTLTEDLYHPSNEYLPRCSALTCDAAVTNGTVTLKDTTTTINQGTTGNVVVVTCETGFTVSASTDQTIVCVTSTQWKDAPTCDPHNCDLVTNAPTLPSGLTLGTPVSPKSGYDIEADLTCAEGYSLTWPAGMSNKMVCDASMAWTNIPTCEPNPCNNITKANGVTQASLVAAKTGVAFTLNCDKGYALSGVNMADTELICTASGAWERDIICQANTCTGDLTIPNAVQVTFPEDLKYTGRSVYVTCYEGYYLDPENYLTILCEGDGSWDDKPDCTAYSCTSALAMSNGDVTPSVNVVTGGIVEVNCDSGYQPLDVANPSYYSVLCGSNGEWTNPVTCNPNQCANPTFPFAAVVAFPEERNQSGEVPEVKCVDGYKRPNENTAVPAANCAADGTWTNPPSCEPNSCGNLNNMVQNGVANPETGLESGATVTVTCNMGHYFPSGPTTTVYCYPNGTWIQPAVCLGYPCNSTTISNVASLSFDPTPPRSGSQPTVLCQTGYNRNPSNLAPAMCLSDGSWSNRPQCQPNECTDPNLLNVANSVSVTFPNSNVISGMVPNIVCQQGYSINITSAVCLANGIWGNRPICSVGDCYGMEVANAISTPSMGTFGQSSQVVCEAYYGPSNGDGIVVCNDNKQWTPAVRCDANECNNSEMEIQNAATVTFENSTYIQTGHAMSSLGCDVGYVSTSNTVVILCQGDGVWTNKPQCQRVTCPSLPLVNGFVEDGTGSQYGDTATVKCYNPYTLRTSTNGGAVAGGIGTTTCDSTGDWSPAYVCTVNDCNPLTFDNGYVVDPPAQITSDVSVTLMCNETYVENGFANPFVVKCAASGKWINRPSCVPRQSGSVCQDHGVAHAQTTPSQPITTAQTTFICDAGYQRSDLATATCNSDGSWTGINLPSCNPYPCDTLTLQNSPAPIQGATTGSAITVQCSKGYGTSVDENFTPLCNETGHWAQQPACLPNECVGIVVTNGGLGSGSAETGTQPVPTCISTNYIALSVPIICLSTGQLEIKPECLSCSQCLTKYNDNYPTILKEFSGTLPDDSTHDVVCGRFTKYDTCLSNPQCSSVRPTTDRWVRERSLLEYVCTPSGREGLILHKSCIEETIASAAGQTCMTSDNVVTIMTAGQDDQCSGRGTVFSCSSSVLRGASSRCEASIRTEAANYFDAFTANADPVSMNLCQPSGSGGKILQPRMMLLFLCSVVGIAGQNQLK